MATMIERQAESIRREIEKLSKSLNIHTERLAKKTTKASAVDALWSREQWFAGKRETGTPEQIEAWWNWTMEQSEVDDLNSRIENAQKRLAKAEAKVEAQKSADANKETPMSRVKALRKIVERVMSERIGGFENMKADTDEDEADHWVAVEWLEQGHEGIVDDIYNNARFERESQEHLKFAGNDKLHEIVEELVTSWGY